jgi:hypothetical protein
MKVLVVYVLPSLNIWGNLEANTESMNSDFYKKVKDFIRDKNPDMEGDPIIVNMIKMDGE